MFVAVLGAGCCMHQDEKAIIGYLKGWPGSFVSGKEIARKVGGRERYEDDRGWAVPVLAQMVRLGFIETDHLGYFRLKPESKKKGPKQFVSPQILRILKTSGKNFETMTIDEEAEDGAAVTSTAGNANNGPGAASK